MLHRLPDRVVAVGASDGPLDELRLAAVAVRGDHRHAVERSPSPAALAA